MKKNIKNIILAVSILCFVSVVAVSIIYFTPKKLTKEWVELKNLTENDISSISIKTESCCGVMEGDTVYVIKTQTAYFKSFLEVVNSTKIKKFLFPEPPMSGGTNTTLVVNLKNNSSFEYKISRGSPYNENWKFVNSDFVSFLKDESHVHDTV